MRIFIIPVLLSCLLSWGSGAVLFAQEDASPLLAEGDALYVSRDVADHHEQAMALYKKAASRDPKSSEALWRLARSLKWKGDIARGKEEKLTHYNEAVEWAKKAIEVDARSAQGHFWLGVAHGRIGETRGVMKSLFLVEPIRKEMKAVLEIDPTHDGAHHVLGVMSRKIPWFMGGSKEKAEEELRKAIAFEPRSTLHHLELAITYVEMKRYQPAREELHALLSIRDPSDPVQAKADREEAEALLATVREK